MSAFPTGFGSGNINPGRRNSSLTAWSATSRSSDSTRNSESTSDIGDENDGHMTPHRSNANRSISASVIDEGLANSRQELFDIELHDLPENSEGGSSIATPTLSKVDTATAPQELSSPASVPASEPIRTSPPAPHFIASRVVRGQTALISPQIQAKLDAAGVKLNPNYKGEITEELIRDLTTPKDQSCALHIMNIHPDATIQEVFRTIHHGKVWSFSSTDPNREWTTGSARLCFTDRRAAEHYLKDSMTGNGIRIRGKPIRVEWDRNCKAPTEASELHQSRVLQIRGPRRKGFTTEELKDYFQRDMQLAIVNRKEWSQGPEEKVIQLEFSSIFAQSRMAFRCFKQRLASEPESVSRLFNIKFAPDPCDPEAKQSVDVFGPVPIPDDQRRKAEAIRSSNWRGGGDGGNGGDGQKYKAGSGPSSDNWRSRS